ncbi:MAG: phosphatidate cytidylyltransferase, partial [Deltaproteobacteria bacterium]|nr:phosphatidate cytidylyltransferase [Deltaproteobacteria bacterium]
MLRARLLTAAVALLPLVFLVCCAPHWLFAGALLGCTGLGLYEYFSLARAHNSLPPAAGLAWGMAVAVAMLLPNAAPVGAVLVAGLFLVFLLALRDPQPARAVARRSQAGAPGKDLPTSRHTLTPPARRSE